MKKRLKLLALLLALLTVFSVVSSCGGKTETPTQTEEKKLVIIKDGVSQYIIVRSDASKTGDADVDGAISIKNALKEYLADGQYAEINTDWKKKDESYDSSTLEILVGDTGYDETATAKENLEAGGWAIKIVGNKICICASADDALTKAVNTFVNLLSTNAKQDENSLYTISIAEKTMVLSGKVERTSLDVPQPEGFTSIGFYKASLENDEAIYAGATREMYDKYYQKLQDEGYAVYSSTEMNNCPFATLYNKEYIIHTGFYENESKIRTIVEPFNENSLYGAESENQYKTVTTTQIAEIGVSYLMSTGSYHNTGACIIVRLCDGRFLVFDGGHSLTREMEHIIEYLKLQSKDYIAETGGKIVIAGWFISHPHSDHWGPLMTGYTLLKSNNIVVENFIYNFMSDEELDKYIAMKGKGYSNSGDNKTMPRMAKALGANVVTCHVGNTYYIANMKMEVLYTIESYTDELPKDLNGLSPLLKMTFYDPETKEEQYTFLEVGDCTGAGFRTAANTFKTYLKCDGAQIPHHGASTWGDDGGVILAFGYILPETLFFTAGNGCLTAYSGKSYIACALNKSKNPNYKEVFMSDVYGRAVILNLPYTPGHAQILTNYCN